MKWQMLLLWGVLMIFFSNYAYAISTANIVRYFPLDGNDSDSTGTENATLVDCVYNNTVDYFKLGGNGAQCSGGVTTRINSNFREQDLDGNYSICVWFKANTAANDDALWGARSTGTPDPSIYFAKNANSWYTYIGETSGADLDQITDDSPYTTIFDSVNWYFVCFLHNNGTFVDKMHVYVNGTEDTTVIASTNTSVLNVRTNVDWFFMARNSQGNTVDTTPGWMDEISIWNKTLSAAEVTELYNAGAGLNPFVVDTIAPVVTLNQTANASKISATNSIQFNFTATTNDGIANCSLWGNFSGTWALNQTNTTTITNNTKFSFPAFSIPSGFYLWNVQCYDTVATPNKAFALSNFTLTVNTAPTVPTINAPTNGTHFKANTTLNWTSTDANSDAITYYLYFEDQAIPLDIVASNSSTGNWTTNISINARYYWRVYSSDGTDISANTSIQQLVLDTVTPTATLRSINSDNTSNISTSTLTLNETCTDTNLYEMLVNITNSTSQTKFSNSTVNITVSSFNVTNVVNLTEWVDGNFTFNLYCSDDSSDSPPQPNYHYLKESQSVINYYETDKNINFTITFELLNPSDNLVSISEINLSSNIVETGTHIKTNYTFLTPDSDSYKVRLTIKSQNNDLVYRTPHSGLPFHFVVGNEKYYHLKDAQESGWTVGNAIFSNGEYTVLLTRDFNQNATWTTLDPKTGGLNTVDEDYRFTLDRTTPTLNGFTVSPSTGVETTVFTIRANCTDSLTGVNATPISNVTNPNGVISSTTMSGTGPQYERNFTGVVVGTHTTQFSCRDVAGNVVSNLSTGVTFSVTATPSPEVGGGGGGGGGGGSGFIRTQTATLELNDPIIAYDIPEANFIVTYTPRKMFRDVKIKNIGDGIFSGKVQTTKGLDQYITARVCEVGDQTVCYSDSFFINPGETKFLLLDGVFPESFGLSSEGIVSLIDKKNNVFELPVIAERPFFYRYYQNFPFGDTEKQKFQAFALSASSMIMLLVYLLSKTP